MDTITAHEETRTIFIGKNFEGADKHKGNKLKKLGQPVALWEILDSNAKYGISFELDNLTPEEKQMLDKRFVALNELIKKFVEENTELLDPQYKKELWKKRNILKAKKESGDKFTLWEIKDKDGEYYIKLNSYNFDDIDYHRLQEQFLPFNIMIKKFCRENRKLFKDRQRTIFDDIEKSSKKTSQN